MINIGMCYFYSFSISQILHANTKSNTGFEIIQQFAIGLYSNL